MSIRYYIKLALAYLSRFKGTIVLGILLGIAIFFIVRVVIPIVKVGEVTRIGLVGRYHTNELPEGILDLIGNGLTKITEGGIVEPEIASSWETPDKGKTWIFHLREDVLWQDQKEVTSDTISYDFSKVRIEKPDSKTLIFMLDEAFSPFPAVLTKPTFRKGLLGTGEWSVDKIIISGGYVRELVLTDNSKNKKIYKFYPTIERTKLAFKLGQVDAISEIYDPNPFADWKTVDLKGTANYNQVVVLFFNVQDKLISEKALRQALAYAIDKDQLGVRAFSPISPNSWAFNPQVKPYTYDLSRAKELLADIPQEAKGNLALKITSTPQLLAIAEKIAKDWESIGMKPTVTVSSIVPTDFQVYLTIFDIPKDPDQYPLWHSTQVETNTNISAYKDLQVDKLLEDGRVELNLEERRKIYLDFQRFLLEDAPAVFLFHPTYYTIKRK